MFFFCLYCLLGISPGTTDNSTSILTNSMSTVNCESTEPPRTGIYIFCVNYSSFPNKQKKSLIFSAVGLPDEALWAAGLGILLLLLVVNVISVIQRR